MLGLFGTSIIGTDHLTGPTSDTEDKTARLTRHDLLRGKPAIQDLGDDASVKQLSFFFDETFCDPETELRQIDIAFKGRIPLRLMFDLVGFEVSFFFIERLSIKRKKTSPTGRVVRIELQVDLIESSDQIGGLLGAAAGVVRALGNPILRRG